MRIQKDAKKGEYAEDSERAINAARFTVFTSMWQAFLSLQLKDEEQLNQFTRKYFILSKIEQANAFFSPHQKRIRKIFEALVADKEPPAEEWRYVQDYIKKHISLTYGYEIVKDPKDNKDRLVIKRIHSTEGALANIYYAFMEGMLSSVNSHNVGMLGRSFNNCDLCRQFFHPEAFHSGSKYCSPYCRLESKRTSQRAKYQKSKKK